MNNHKEAYNKLLNALMMLGIHMDEVYTEVEDNGLKVQINMGGQYIDVHISNYWRYPDVSSYFVNLNKDPKNFICNPGTPFIEQAIYDIGYCQGHFKG